MLRPTTFLVLSVAACFALPIPQPNPLGYTPAMTEFDVKGSSVFYTVYRAHNVVDSLANKNAASPGGEIDFLGTVYEYEDGLIIRECIEMFNTPFSEYECCRGGQCSASMCTIRMPGTGTNTNGAPGRALFGNWPVDSPCKGQQEPAHCSGYPTDHCSDACEGWWFSFPEQYQCPDDKPIGTNNCTWKSASVVETIDYGTLINDPKWIAKHYSSIQWSHFLDEVELMVSYFNNSSQVTLYEKDSSGNFNPAPSAKPGNPRDSCRVVRS
mmetsp:Transcript_5578/g.12279  ORF Transcript_5578/g.12279 Transcript_5578/m.12279 type:complete len:268 (-) Transcript_5578:64-867(-)